MAWDDELEGAALEFAGSEARYLRALAGPGTGKTFALLRRLARLLEDGAQPNRILVVTFARTAARDIVSKLQETEVEGIDDVDARTLHSYCFQSVGNTSGFCLSTRTLGGPIAGAQQP